MAIIHTTTHEPVTTVKVTELAATDQATESVTTNQITEPITTAQKYYYWDYEISK